MSFLTSGAAVGGGLAALGGIAGAGASLYAGGQQADSAAQALAFQQKQYAQTQKDLQPYKANGESALGYLGRVNSGDMSKFFTSPDYMFRLNQGVSALQNSAASRGGLLSGNAMRGITDYGQNAASSEFGNYWNRMFQQSQLGQSAATGGAQIGAGQAGQIGNTMMGIGQANASGAVGAANSINGGIQNYALMNYLNKGSPSAYTPSAPAVGGAGYQPFPVEG